MAHKRKSVAIGIDLGAWYSCVGVWQNDHVEIIADGLGNKTTPSTVAFTDTGILVGDDAEKQVAMNLRNTVYDAKRLIGRRFSDTSVQSDMKSWPFKVVPGPSEKPIFVVNYNGEENQFSAEEISAMVLIKLKEIAEAFLGSIVKNAVVTVPAYFTNSQRKATKDAGILSGFKNVRIINEPTAAALAYGLDKKVVGEKNVLIFDLGGGTLDVTLLAIKEGIFEVKSIAGDTHLGGDNFDNQMMHHFMKEFKRKHHKDVSGNTRALGILKASCEKAKRTLSFSTQTTIEIDSFHEGIDFYFNISRNRFEALNIDLFQKCIYNVEKCLNYAKIEKSDVHEVVLVGGSTWIPKIQQLLQEFFNGKDLCKSINPDEVVAYGAAVQAACLNYEGKQKFQDKVLENFCNRIVEEHEKLEAKSSLENYLYHMRCIVKKVEDAIYEADSWLDANQLAEVDEFEDKMKGLESTVAELYQKDFVGWSIDENDKKNMEAKKKLGKYVHTMGEMVYMFKEKLGVSDKRKIKNAIGEVSLWLHRNPIENADEFEYKLKELERICNPIVLKMHEGGAFPIGWSMEEDRESNLKAKNAFENYLYNMRNTMKDEIFWEKFNLRDKKIIEDISDEAILWLDANQEANGFEAKLRELESVYNPIIVKMYQGGSFGASWWMEEEYKKNLEAKNALEYYTYNMENTMKDERIGGKLDVTNKKIIEDTIGEAILWLDSNKTSEANEFEYKLKELESVCNPIIFKMYQDGTLGAGWSIEEEYKNNMEAKNTLENYIYNMETTINEERIREKLGIVNKRKIEDAIFEAISWLDANQLADVDEFEYKLNELESICNPIIAKMYEHVNVASSSESEMEYKKNLEAKNALEYYIYNMKKTVKDEKIRENLSETNKKKIEDTIDERVSWLAANQLAEADEFEYNLKVLENVCNPIIQKVFEDGALAAGWSLEDEYKNMEAKNDENIGEKLGVTNMKKTGDAMMKQFRGWMRIILRKRMSLNISK